MVTNIEKYLKEYLVDKLDVLCEELLAGQMEEAYDLEYRAYGFSFNTIFEELIFVILYEDNSYDIFPRNLIDKIYYSLGNLNDEEVTYFLSLYIKRKFLI